MSSGRLKELPNYFAYLTMNDLCKPQLSALQQQRETADSPDDKYTGSAASTRTDHFEALRGHLTVLLASCSARV